MDYFQAIILAIVQGLTEFLPVSSSAHLILVPELLGWAEHSLTFDVAVHVGTLLAVVIFLRKEVTTIVPAWMNGWQSLQWNVNGLLGWWVILGTIPAGLVGLFLGDYIELNLRSALVIACTTLVFGILLGVADRQGKHNSRNMQSMTSTNALFVGLAQALALIPGTSRSGVTMTAMLAIGYSRVEAARFSFLLSIPIILLSGGFTLFELFEQKQSFNIGLLLLGSLVSAVIALVSMHWFIQLVQRVGMLPFVIYRLILAVIIFIVLV